MPKQYKQLKNIQLQSILDLDEGPFRIECLNRLKECGFIEEIEKSEYRFGQRFKLYGAEYILSFIKDNQAALVNIKTGWTWSGLKSIQSSNLVTQAEFAVLCDTTEFELIE